MREQTAAALLDDLHPGQRWILDLQKDYTAVLMARRGGKTRSCLHLAVHGCLTADYRVAWISQYPQVADEVISPVLDEMASLYDLKIAKNKQTHTHSIGGGFIKCYGVESERFVETLRGKSFDLIIIDEAQSLFYVDLPYVLTSVLRPTLDDRSGQLIMVGTPGDVCMGLFWKIAKLNGAVEGAASDGIEDSDTSLEDSVATQFSFVQGVPFSNPYLEKQQRKTLDDLREENPDIDSQPWVLREYYNRWVSDNRNRVISIEPALSYLTDYSFEPDDRYILGIDYGFDPDGTAFTVATYNPRRHNWLVYLESFEQRKMLEEAIAKQIEEYMARYPSNLSIVLDSSGAGKSVIERLRQVHHLPVKEASKKEDRRTTINAINSEASLGRIKFFNVVKPESPEESPVARQWQNLSWVKTKRGLIEGRPRNIHDSAMYSFRVAKTFLHKPKTELSIEEQHLAKLKKKVKNRLRTNMFL